jgi:hypothetical protein
LLEPYSNTQETLDRFRLVSNDSRKLEVLH